MTAQTMEAAGMSRPTEEAEAVTLAPEDPRPHGVILGGGVAGLTAAYELCRRLGERARITVVSSSERFQLGPALLWVPFGRKTSTIGFSIATALRKHGIQFVHARVEHVIPERCIVSAQGTEIRYDYLLIATGPRADGTAIPGVSGQFNATESIWTEGLAVEAGHALECFLESPGPVVVGAAQGAGYVSAAYEFALSLDAELRCRGTRDQATITFVTPEPYLGYLDIGSRGVQRVLGRLFARRNIGVIAAAEIARADRGSVCLRDGRTLPAAYTMIVPPFSGVVGIWKSPQLTDEHGFVPVDTHYRHMRYPQIYAAGVAAQAAITSPAAESLPKTGYLSATMARAAAQNIAAAITGGAPARRPLPRLIDLRIIDGGDTGALLVAADLVRPLRLALPLPGRTAHWAKGLLTRYLLWKLRTGRTSLP